MGVVDALEPVEIDEGHVYSPVHTLGLGQQTLQFLDHIAPVGQTGKRVVQGIVLEFKVGRLQAGVVQKPVRQQ